MFEHKCLNTASKLVYLASQVSLQLTSKLCLCPKSGFFEQIPSFVWDDKYKGKNWVTDRQCNTWSYWDSWPTSTPPYVTHFLWLSLSSFPSENHLMIIVDHIHWQNIHSKKLKLHTHSIPWSWIRAWRVSATLPRLFYYPYPTRKCFQNFRVQGSN